MLVNSSQARELSLTDLANRQHGVVSQRQLSTLGVDRHGVRRRIHTGRLTVIHRGVFAVGHRALTKHGRYLAAVLACGPGAVLSHRSAADLLGILAVDGPAAHVAIPSRAGRSGQPGIVLHRPRTLTADETTVVDAIPATTAPRTLLVLADHISARRLRRACDTAERARIVDWADVLALVDRHPRKTGAHRLRAVLAQHGIGADPAHSDLARKLRAFCDAHGFPAPSQNQTVLGYMPDFCWPEHRLIAETDGWDVHRTRFAFEADRARDLSLVAAGWRVVRITEARLDHDATALERDMRPLFRTA